MPLMWCEETEKCITSQSLSLCSRAVLDTAGCHWARPASGGDSQASLDSLGPTVGTETHRTVSGALTSVHWTRGHVSLAETASQENCQSEDKEEVP